MSQFSDMKSGVEMRDHIVGKATDDAKFRARLVADPKEVLTEEFGVELPDNFALSVHEDSSTHVHLVLPPTGPIDSAVLQQVSGGNDCWASGPQADPPN